MLRESLEELVAQSLWILKMSEFILSLVVENVCGVSTVQELLAKKRSYSVTVPIKLFEYGCEEHCFYLYSDIIDREMEDDRFHVFGKNSDFYISAVKHLRSVFRKVKVSRKAETNGSHFYSFSPEMCRCLAHFIYTFGFNRHGQTGPGDATYIHKCLEKAILFDHYWCLVVLVEPSKKKVSQNLSLKNKERSFYFSTANMKYIHTTVTRKLIRGRGD